MQLTPAELLAKQQFYRKHIAAIVKPAKGPHGLFRRSEVTYESVKGLGASVIGELTIQEALTEGHSLVEKLEFRREMIRTWTCRTASESLAECDALLHRFQDVTHRIFKDLSVCCKHREEAKWKASEKKRMLAAESGNDASLLIGRAGDLRDTLVGIIKPGLDDPSAFVEKGVVKDPMEFTQAEVNKCVLFGWNGVLNNADTCHHLLMMFFPRCSAPPNPDPGSPLRGSPIREIAIAFPRSLGTFGECGVGASSPITLCHRKDPVARPLTPLVDFDPVCHV